MAYYLMIENKKGEYCPININRSTYFTTNPSYKKDGACTLSEIDLFTTCFDNEDMMRMHLLESGILPLDKSNKKLSIRISSRGSYNKVPHGFLFRKDLEYIVEPNKLINMIMKRYYANNLMFIHKLANHFVNFYECGCTATEVRGLLDISIRSGKRNYQLDIIDENGDNLVKRLLKLIVFDYEQNPITGRVDYHNEVNYRNLHCLIAFVNNYDEKINNLFVDDNKDNSKVKKRVLEKKSNQVTFDDLIKKTHLN